MPVQMKLNLPFDASEWIALCEIAQKHGTTIDSLLRIGAMLVIEADRRGAFQIIAKTSAAKVIDAATGGLVQ